MTSAVRACAGLALLLAPACSENATDGTIAGHRLQGATMGTVWHAKVWLEDGAKISVVEASIAEALDMVDRNMSTYKKDSDLSKFNRAAPNEWVKVHPLTLIVALRSLQVAEKSDGAFDPTVMPLVDLWSFGPGERSLEAPSLEQIQKTLSTIGWQAIDINQDDGSIRKNRPGVELDFSAIAKGFGADYAASAALSSGASAVLIEVGGEIKVFGNKPNHEPWQVAVESPNNGMDFGVESQKIIELPASSAMATSGDYRNWREVNGERISHTIDPRTGLTVTHEMASASVIAKDCMTADAMATALMVLGPEQGIQLVEKLNEVECYLILRHGKGFKEIRSSGFPNGN